MRYWKTPITNVGFKNYPIDLPVQPGLLGSNQLVLDRFLTDHFWTIVLDDRFDQFLTKVPRPIEQEKCSLVEDRNPFRPTNYDLPKTYDIYLDGDIYLSDLDFSENITMIGGGFLGTDSSNYLLALDSGRF